MENTGLWSTLWPVLVILIAGGILPLGGVLLGGWLVYRTKRTPDESLFKFSQPPGMAVNLDEIDAEDELDTASALKEAQEFVAKHTDRFESQFAGVGKVAEDIGK